MSPADREQPYCLVTVTNTGDTFICGRDEYILDAAFDNGLSLPHNCRGGACGRCKAKVISGDVAEGFLPGWGITEEERQAGMALICSTVPASPNLHIEMVEAMAERSPEAVRGMATVVAAEAIAPRVLRLVVALPADQRPAIHPGACAELEVPGVKPNRRYSIASSPAGNAAEAHLLLEFFVSRHPDGVASGWLHEHARVGQQLWTVAPLGGVEMEPLRGRPVLALAGGTGIASVLPVLEALADKGPVSMTVVFSVRARADVFGLDRLLAIQHKRDVDLGIHVVLTRESAVPESSVVHWWAGRVPEMLPRIVPDPRECAAFVAGTPGFVDSCMEAAIAGGVDRERIVVDSFAPAGTEAGGRP